MEALAGDGEGHLVPTPVRREKIKASKRELALEADRVLKQADGVSSLRSASPPRRQPRNKPVSSMDDGSIRRKNSFGGTDSTKWNSEGEFNEGCRSAARIEFNTPSLASVSTHGIADRHI